jgi:hypothetical protein
LGASAGWAASDQEELFGCGIHHSAFLLDLALEHRKSVQDNGIRSQPFALMLLLFGLLFVCKILLDTKLDNLADKWQRERLI